MFRSAQYTVSRGLFLRDLWGSNCSGIVVPVHNRGYAISAKIREKEKKVPLILLEYVRNLGVRGEVKKVKPGFARNFLLPQRKAILASTHNLKKYPELLENVDTTVIDQEKRVKKNRKKLSKVLLQMKRHVVSDTPFRLHSPVTAENISEKLRQHHNLEVDARQINIREGKISAFGTHVVTVKLTEDEVVELRVELKRR